MNMSLAFKHNPFTSCSASCTLFPGRLPFTSSRREIMLSMSISCVDMVVLYAHIVVVKSLYRRFLRYVVARSQRLGEGCDDDGTKDAKRCQTPLSDTPLTVSRRKSDPSIRLQSDLSSELDGEQYNRLTHMLKLSAGVLLRSKGKFLLCHATKSKNHLVKQFDGNWTIPKVSLAQTVEITNCQGNCGNWRKPNTSCNKRT